MTVLSFSLCHSVSVVFLCFFTTEVRRHKEYLLLSAPCALRPAFHHKDTESQRLFFFLFFLCVLVPSWFFFVFSQRRYEGTKNIYCSQRPAPCALHFTTKTRSHKGYSFSYFFFVSGVSVVFLCFFTTEVRRHKEYLLLSAPCALHFFSPQRHKGTENNLSR
jgi:hypothetical protein